MTTRLASRNEIDYEGSFTLDAACETVWSTITQFDSFTDWWSWLRDFDVEGPGLEPGSVLHGRVVAPIPYEMRVDVTLDACEAPYRIDATIHGDLEGHAHIVIDPEGDHSRVTARWTVELMQTPMRAAATIAWPLLRVGHDRVVASTVASFRRRLRPA